MNQANLIQLFGKLEGLIDYLPHVEVLIHSKPSSEDDVSFAFGQFLVFFKQFGVLLVIHWVIGLLSLGPGFRVFPCDYGLWGLGGFEVLVLDDTCERGFSVGIVYDGISLVVFHIEGFELKVKPTVFELSVAVVEVLVNHSCEYDLVGHAHPLVPVVEKVGVESDLNAFKHLFNDCGVSSDRYSLVEVIEVVVVECVPYGQSLYDECRKVPAVTSPLLFGVSLDELFVDVLSDKGYCLLLKVFRVFNLEFGLLLLNFCLCLLRGLHSPHLVECVHVEWQVVEFALVVGHR